MINKNWPKFRPKVILIILCALLLLHAFGVFTHVREKDYFTSFSYPYEGDIQQSVRQLRDNLTPDIAPINGYNYSFMYNLRDKCKTDEELRLVYIVKSAPEHFDRRLAIRNSWGFQARFSDVQIRTVFVLGRRNDPALQSQIGFEAERLQDIVQVDFHDDYFNNTIKTMSALKWVTQFCPNARFYMFVDDDYYVSTKNVLRFLRNPTEYPRYLQRPVYTMNKNNPLDRMKRTVDFDLSEKVRLYAGYVFFSAPHRHFTSKWQVSLDEYPYHLWPPYVTAGAFVLSKEALLEMYYTSFYTKHFRFDDIFVGLLAKKARIEPFHNDEFYFKRKSYDKKGYQFVVASHGYDDPEELVRVWTEQKSLGNA